MAILAIVGFGGCVFVGRHGSYTRQEIINQDGSNSLRKVDINLSKP